MSEFAHKTVAVVGLARSGVACARVLTELGATVQVYDSKPESALDPVHVAAARALGVELRLGGVPVDYVELDYLITSPGVPKSAPVLQDAVAAGVPVLGEIEAAYRVARAPILAITGTNGKTTTTVLLGEMLRAAGIETFVAGNIAAGEIALPLIEAAHKAPAGAAIVAEISSFQLEWVTTFRPKVAALLNITPDHQDRQTWDEYVAAKWRIFAFQGADGFAVLNWTLLKDKHLAHAIDPNVTWFTVVGPGANVHLGDLGEEYTVYCSHREDDVVLIRFGWFESDGKTFHAQEDTCLCNASEVKLPGAHNLDNICAAAAMATAFGVGVEPIQRVATTFTGVVHRLEYVDTVDGARYVNNSMCTNAAAFARSLEALPEPKVVIAGGVWKGGALAPLVDAVKDNNTRAVVLIGKSAGEMEAALRGAGYANVVNAGTLATAVSEARRLAQVGDTVLLAPACASFDQFRDFEDRGEQFKALVRAAGA